MSLEPYLIEIILQYCNEEKNIDTLEEFCFTLYENKEKPNQPRFHLQRSSFSLGSYVIQGDFYIESLMIRKFSQSLCLCYGAFPDDIISTGTLQNSLKKVVISEKFLCFIDFCYGSFPKEKYGSLQTGQFQTEAQFTDVVTREILLGILQGYQEDDGRLFCLRFCPLGWMGNPTEMDVLRISLQDLEASDLNQRNEDFAQQFCWWTPDDQNIYWKKLRILLEPCLRV